jgi:hypothetical protein
MSKARLHYINIGTIVTVVVHTGESNSTYEAVDILKQFEVDAADFPTSFSTGSDEVTKTLAGYGLQKLLQERTSRLRS